MLDLLAEVIYGQFLNSHSTSQD